MATSALGTYSSGGAAEHADEGSDWRNRSNRNNWGARCHTYWNEWSGATEHNEDSAGTHWRERAYDWNEQTDRRGAAEHGTEGRQWRNWQDRTGDTEHTDWRPGSNWYERPEPEHGAPEHVARAGLATVPEHGVPEHVARAGLATEPPHADTEAVSGSIVAHTEHGATEHVLKCPTCRRGLCQAQDICFFHRYNPQGGEEVHMILRPERPMPPTLIPAQGVERGATQSWQCTCGAKLGDTRPVGPQKAMMTAFNC